MDPSVENLAVKLEQKVQEMKKESARQMEELAHQRLQLEREKEDLVKYRIDDPVIVLNVGGKVYLAQKKVLTRFPGSVLEAMFNGRYPHYKDAKGRYYIEGDGKSFRYIMHFLRHGDIRWPAGEEDQKMLMDELKYFKLDKYVKSQPPQLKETASEYEFRMLKALGTTISKINEVDSDLKISSTLGKTAVIGVKKAIELDNAYHIHEKLGATIATGAQLACDIDAKFGIHQKVTSAVITGCTKAYEIDKQYQIHDKLGSLVQNTYSAAVTLDNQYKIGEKVTGGLKAGFQVACEIDKQFKMQEKLSGVMMVGLGWMFGGKNSNDSSKNNDFVETE